MEFWCKLKKGGKMSEEKIKENTVGQEIRNKLVIITMEIMAENLTSNLTIRDAVRDIQKVSEIPEVNKIRFEKGRYKMNKEYSEAIKIIKEEILVYKQGMKDGFIRVYMGITDEGVDNRKAIPQLENVLKFMEGASKNKFLLNEKSINLLRGQWREIKKLRKENELLGKKEKHHPGFGFYLEMDAMKRKIKELYRDNEKLKKIITNTQKYIKILPKSMREG